MAAARSLWNGTIAFGAVAVPVKLHTAADSPSVGFHEVHETDGAKVEHRRVCPKEDKVVPKEEVVRGYEIKKGEYVVVGKEEADAAAGERTRIIDVEHFVDVDAVDPVHFDHPYLLGAGKDGGEAYRLLHDALARTGRAAIGRFTFHKREYLVAIRAADDVLALHTMRFADELVPAKELDIGKVTKKPEKREVDMAAQLIDALHEPFKPSKYHDEYRAKVLKAAKQKAKGKELATQPEPEPDDDAGDDLMAALQASVKGAR